MSEGARVISVGAKGMDEGARGMGGGAKGMDEGVCLSKRSKPVERASSRARVRRDKRWL